MANQTSGNSGASSPGTSDKSRADQPTPVSSSTQSQGNQMGQASSGDLKQVGTELAQEAKSAVSNAASQVKSQATDLADAAQEQATSYLDEQKGMAAGRIEGVASALRQAGQELAGNDEDTLAQYTNTLAEQLDKFSSSLRDREIGSLIEDAKQLAYRQPELFVAGALAAGFVIGRFFKSSRRASRDNNNSYGEYDPRDPSRMYGQQYGENYRQEFGRYPGSAYSQGYGSGYRSGYGSQSGQASGQSYGTSAGQPTTHGLGSGQSMDQEADLRRGQEFGQGEEKASNSSTQPSGSSRPNTRQGGDAT